MFDGKSILVTGGTGSFGKHFVSYVMKHYKPKKLVILSRDELKQFEMSQVFCDKGDSPIRYYLGDVRDYKRLLRAFKDIEFVVHAAALKQVPAAEYNPMEFIKTNVLGAENVICAAIDAGVKNVVALSTDKAAAPVNLYGASKLCSDKLFVSANNIKGNNDIKFSVVRYGNVMGSRGSVIPLFMKQRKNGFVTITDKRMTRFNISLDDAVDLVMFALKNAWGGEIFVPQIPSYKITDVVEAVAPNCKVKEIGIRPGEKIHEEMITEADSYTTVDLKSCYAILPTNPFFWNHEEYLKVNKCQFVEPGFTLNSGRNHEWLNPQSLRELIVKHLDPNFTV